MLLKLIYSHLGSFIQHLVSVRQCIKNPYRKNAFIKKISTAIEILKDFEDNREKLKEYEFIS